jgi:uncharacterized membrane protein (DUF485 family)
MDVKALRRRQLKFALSFGIPYLIFILAIYFFVYLGGQAATAPKVGNLPLHYFLVAVFVYPVTWIVVIWYVRKANALEGKLERQVGKE